MTDKIIMENILATNAAWNALLVALVQSESIDLDALEKQLTTAQLLFVEKKASIAAEALVPHLSATRKLKSHAEL